MFIENKKKYRNDKNKLNNDDKNSHNDRVQVTEIRAKCRAGFDNSQEDFRKKGISIFAFKRSEISGGDRGGCRD